MKIKEVKPIDGQETKSIQELEAELIAKEEEKRGGTPGEGAAGDQEEDVIDLKEEDVLKFIGSKLNKEIKSLDELLAPKIETKEPELPEDVSAFWNFKKETGRGLKDFYEVQKDIDSMDEDSLLKSYLKSTEEGLDDSDIEVLMQDYSYDEDIDDENHVNKIKIARKKAINKAKDYFKSIKDKYKAPLESSMAALSDEDKEKFEAYKKYLEQSSEEEKASTEKRSFFMKKTEELFNPEFKGFEFEVGEKKVVFNPGDPNELKKNQATPMNLIGKFLDEKGFIKDAVGYHKALSIAMNPEKFANYFYEQGKSDGVDSLMKKQKNINMKENPANVGIRAAGGLSARSTEPKGESSIGRLKIKSIK